MEETELQTLALERRYRAIARELIRLERERGIFDFDELTQDPELAVSASGEVSIEYASSPRAGCSVFGYYQFRSAPPSVIVVHPSMTSARDRFTVLHELGHHIQRQHLVWATVRYSIRGVAGERIEERVADAIAAEILVPSVDGAETLTISAEILSRLHSQSRASRSVVAMRAVEVAPDSETVVVLVLDSEGVVIFARAAGDDVFAPARGQVQPGLRTLFEVARNGQGTASGPLSNGLHTQSGWAQEELNADLALDNSGHYAFVVLRPAQRYGRVPVWDRNEVECTNEACGSVFVVDATVTMCSRCSSPKCPECSSCSCTLELEAVCGSCFMGLSVAERNGVIPHECP